MKDKNQENFPEAKKFGAILRKRLDQLGKTQREVAKEVGISEVAMSRYIKGMRMPRAEIMMRLFDVLKLEQFDMSQMMKSEEKLNKTPSLLKNLFKDGTIAEVVEILLNLPEKDRKRVLKVVQAFIKE